MAVLDILPEIEVTVSVDKVALQEYPDDEADAQTSNQARRTVSKYIECISHAQFWVGTSIKRQYKLNCRSLAFEVLVDGSRATSRLVRPFKLNAQVP